MVGHRGIPLNKNVFVELLVVAMDILMKLAKPDTPLWIRTLNGGKDLNREEYLRVFPPCFGIQQNEFVFEASRHSGVVLINSLALVDTLMDSVTWIEHWEYDEGVIQCLYRPLVRYGWGFGARWWFANLQRQCKCLSILKSTVEIVEHPSGLGPDGRKSFVALARRMMNNFSSRVCVSSLRKWDKLHVEGVSKDLRVLIRESFNDPGEPTGIVLSAATSIWHPTTMQRLFDFLSNERMRSHWDVLLIDGQMQGITHIFKGHDADNCVSNICYDVIHLVYQNGNPANDPIILLQETRNDTSGSLVMYTPLDLHSVNMVMRGTDSSMVVVLLSGFAIHSDDHTGHGTTSNYNEESNFNETARGCILTVGFQILINNQPNNQISVESVDTVNKLITSTIQKINAAIQET
ncbi:hypothetical protein Ddye_013656 [Dipteronia dyeriana]|uniref:START domain-containing protein n=1 Tax=Dipteronia dyeriana TaxID=168575 RepID=A0AAE0CJU8_9ROSI|nr:hypothetical protein Ddye_013656 [Dipteronia dyeriana]